MTKGQADKPWRERASQILSYMDNIAKNVYKQANGENEKIKISMWEVLDAADVPRPTFYGRNYPTTLNNIGGVKYENGELTIKSETYLRARTTVNLSDIDV